MRMSVRVALTPPYAHEWRNWKTRQAKDLMSARACEFESHLVYHLCCV